MALLDEFRATLANSWRSLRSLWPYPPPADGGWGAGDRELRALLGAGDPVAAGVAVTEQSALSVPAFASAVSLIADAMASVPIHAYVRRGEARERVRGPLDTLVSRRPNPEQTSFAFRRAMLIDALVTGAAYAEIQAAQSGRAVALWPIASHRVETLRDARGAVTYRVSSPNGGDVLVPADRMLVILYCTRDGYTPVSPVTRLKQTLGLSLAAELYAARFFGNGASMGGVLVHPARMTPAAREHFQRQLTERHVGPERAHRLLLLEEGIKFEATTVEPEKTQLLELRQFQINEVARAYNLPPTMIGGSLEGGLQYANTISEAERFVRQCLVPIATLVEEELSAKLLGPREQDDHYYEFSFNGLLRGAPADRFAAYEIAIRSGVLTVDEARVRENLPPLSESTTPAAAARSSRGVPHVKRRLVERDAYGRISGLIDAEGPAGSAPELTPPAPSNN